MLVFENFGGKRYQKQGRTMRLIATDKKGRRHVISASDVFYEEDVHDLIVTAQSGDSYFVKKMDRYRAEELIKKLYNDGTAELPSSYRIEI